MNIESLYDRLEKVAYYSNVPEELAYMTTNITPKECAEILRHFREQNEEIERLNNIIEKAVEYIEKHRKIYKLGVNQETDEFDYISTSPQVLLNILRGEE